MVRKELIVSKRTCLDHSVNARYIIGTGLSHFECHAFVGLIATTGHFDKDLINLTGKLKFCGRECKIFSPTKDGYRLL